MIPLLYKASAYGESAFKIQVLCSVNVWYCGSDVSFGIGLTVLKSFSGTYLA